MPDGVKEKFIEWVKAHPDVFEGTIGSETRLFAIEPWWWIQDLMTTLNLISPADLNAIYKDLNNN